MRYEGDEMSFGTNWTVCCKCKNKARNHESNVWVEIPKLMELLDGKMVSHGYCPECFEAARAELAGIDED